MYNSSVQAMQWNTWRVGMFIYHLDFKIFPIELIYLNTRY